MKPILAVPTSVYRYYDVHNILLYVGITSRGARRNQEHNAGKEWWAWVHRQDVDHYASRELATAREKHLIESHRPPFNKQHNRDHAAQRAAYLLFASLPGDVDQKATFGGRPASRRARQLVTGLSHRLPLTKISETDRQVTYASRTDHFALAECVNFANDVPLCNPTKTGSFSRAKRDGNRIQFTFSRAGERKIPNRVILRLRVTQRPMTIWAHKAEAA